MIGQLSFIAHLRSSTGVIFSFYILRAYHSSFSAISWSLSNDKNDERENETFVESYEEDSNDIDSYSLKKDECDFSCRNIHSCDYTDYQFRDSSDIFLIGECCSIDFSSKEICCISISSQKKTEIRFSFMCQKGIVYNLKPNDFCRGRVEGSVSYRSGQTDVLTGNGWITARNFYVDTSQPVASPSFVLCGANAWGESFCISTLQQDENKLNTALLLFGKDKTNVEGTCDIVVSKTWTSMWSFQSFPSALQVRHSSSGLSLSVDVSEPFSEFYSIFSHGYGQMCSTFTGMLERDFSGSSEICGAVIFFAIEKRSIEDMMGKVGHIVQKELRKRLLSPRKHGVEQYIYDAVYSPIETLINIGGKSWRSFLFCILCGFWGTPNANYIKYCQIVEILHLGSLIIDDIEDNSTTRRGCPCVHTIVGTPLAINSGCSCFFLALKLAEIDSLPPEKCLTIYQLTMETLRAGHVGQGLDIFGLHSATMDALQTEDFDKLFELVEYVHLLKSGEFVAYICKLACILSDAPKHVIEPLYLFGKNLGIAFQIIDDILDISSTKRKKFAEDIRNGKITYPVAKALQLLPPQPRRNLYTKISSRPSSQEEIQEILRIIHSTNAIPFSQEKARNLVERGWIAVEHLLPTSFQKKYLLSLCHFTIKRTY